MRKIFRLLSHIPLGFYITVLLIVLFFLPIRLINFLELKLLDTRFLSAQRSPKTSDIVLVAVDNRSEDRLGRWPWDRSKMAELVDMVSMGKPAVIGIDIVFAEKQVSPLDKILAIPEAEKELSGVKLRKIREACDYDGQLARSIAKAGNVVLGYYFLLEEDTGAAAEELEGKGPKYRILVEEFQGVIVQSARPGERCFPCVRSGYGVETSTELISAAPLAQGYLNIFPDADGVVRKSFLVMRHGSDWFAAFPLEVLNVYYGQPGISLRVIGMSGEGVESLKLGDRQIPVDLDASLWVDYTRKLDSFPTYSFVDVLEGRVNVKNFEKKIVLVGISDPGLMRDHWITPVSNITAGFKIHALTIATCLENRFIHQSGYYFWLNVFFILFFGTLLTILIPRVKHLLQGAILAGFLFLGYTLAAFWVFRQMRIAVNMVYPLGCIVVVYTVETLRHTGVSLARAIRKILQKETALKMLGETQNELSRLVRVSDVFSPSSSCQVSPFVSEEMMEETPALTWRLILTSLGISSGALLLFTPEENFQVIASVGNLWEKTNLKAIRKRMETVSTPLLVNQQSGRNEWFSSPEIYNLMAFSVVSDKAFQLVGLFLNKSITGFSETNRFTPDDVKLAQTAALQAIIAIQNSRLNVALKQAQLDTIFRLAMSIECRDRETGLHVHRVSEYAGIVAEGIKLPVPEVKLIRSAMPLHDIGKIAIPDSILLKPGRLTDEEFAIIKQHPITGAKVLEGSSSAILQAARVIALYHQERYDGSGYPYRLKGEDIPLYGRIAAVADIFDALASKRSYKEALGLEKTFEIMLQEAGKTMDPKLVEVFLERQETVLKVYNHYREAPDKSPFHYPAR